MIPLTSTLEARFSVVILAVRDGPSSWCSERQVRRRWAREVVGRISPTERISSRGSLERDMTEGRWWRAVMGCRDMAKVGCRGGVGGRGDVGRCGVTESPDRSIPRNTPSSAHPGPRRFANGPLFGLISEHIPWPLDSYLKRDSEPQTSTPRVPTLRRSSVSIVYFSPGLRYRKLINVIPFLWPVSKRKLPIKGAKPNTRWPRKVSKISC